MMQFAPCDLSKHQKNFVRESIALDVKNLIEKYHNMLGDGSTIDNDLADALILLEMRNAIKSFQDNKLEKIIN